MEPWAGAPAWIALASIEIRIPPGAILEAIEGTLVEAGVAVASAGDREIGRVERERPSLIVIGGDTVTNETLGAVARAARARRTRVLVVTRERDPQAVADVLRAGADDYLPFPFDRDELRARTFSLIAFSLSQPARHRHGSFRLDFGERSVIGDEAKVVLSSAEWLLLLTLIDAEEQPVPPVRLVGRATRDGSTTAIASMMSRLRRKLRAAGVSGVSIDNVSERGYALRFQNPIDEP